MQKTTKRCRIWIPLWRPEALEAWFSDMSAKGWALESIDEGIGCFKKIDPIHQHYYCYLSENRKMSPTQTENVLSVGWKFITSDEGLYIFTSETERSKPGSNNSEDARRRRISLFVKLKPKSKFDHAAMVFVIGPVLADILRVLAKKESYVSIWKPEYQLLLAFVSLAFILIDWRYCKTEKQFVYSLNQNENDPDNIGYETIINRRRSRIWAAVFCYCAAIALLFFGPSISNLPEFFKLA